MCGIAGQVCLQENAAVHPNLVEGMLALLQHRGPEHAGLLVTPRAALGNSRLSGIDLKGGNQPISSPDQSQWIVVNGEIFNYPELRQDLRKLGCRFSSNSDTEVLLHIFREYGTKGLDLLNGQFSAAFLDLRENTVMLARDRLGVRPLFYVILNGSLFFASEVTALLALPGVSNELDPQALADIFTYWTLPGGRTCYQAIREVPPGSCLTIRDGEIEETAWFTPLFRSPDPARSVGEYQDTFEQLLRQAVRFRLRSDVPVGTYLSGGLDSAVITALVRQETNQDLQTFSIGFESPLFDETKHQNLLARHLGATHHAMRFSSRDVGSAFPEVVRSAGTPILRTAPVPMYLLSGLVRRHEIKVVLTGEAADEFLGGYDIFKEMKVRRFWAKDPQSDLRSRLTLSLYPHMRGARTRNDFFLNFFRQGLNETADNWYAHRLRWSNTGKIRRFLDGSPCETPAEEAFPFPPAASGWSHLAKAQYTEIISFLSPYLLSSQGYRMAMAHSVEGRYPFLDAELIDFMLAIPDDLKLPGLGEKWILRQLAKKLLPREIWARRKQPYRAPIQECFFQPQPLAWVSEMLSPPVVESSRLFNPTAVAGLYSKAASGKSLGEVEEMALVGILSTLILSTSGKPSMPRKTNVEMVTVP